MRTGDVRPGDVKRQGRLNKCLLSTLSTLLGARSTVMNKAGQAPALSNCNASQQRPTIDKSLATHCWVVLCREMNQDKGGGGGRGGLFD